VNAALTEHNAIVSLHTFDKMLELWRVGAASGARGHTQEQRRHLSMQVVVVAAEENDVHLGPAFFQG
jgi:hypothetical protein